MAGEHVFLSGADAAKDVLQAMCFDRGNGRRLWSHDVAKGILEALHNFQSAVPMVARLVGTNEAEGRRILADAQMMTADTLAAAAEKAKVINEAYQIIARRRGIR